ncbi:MAG: Gfo/Idh/MocA family oxidoreductase [Lentisphaeria bacterium]
MNPIKIAQIGISHEHAAGKIATLRQMPDVFEIVGVVDDSASTAAKVPSARENFDGLPFVSEEELYRIPGLQCVTVEVPNGDLVPTALRCMEHKLPMHMDKPGGEDLALFKKLLDGCKAKKLPFQMGYMFRGNPAFQFCLKILREKWLGEVFAMDADMNHNYGGDAYQEYLGKFHGGIMFNLGCHLIDFVVAAMGAPRNVVPFLQSTADLPDSIHNNCTAVLEYPHANLVLRSCSRMSGCVASRRMRIAGTNGWIDLSPLERFDDVPISLTMRLTTPKGGYDAGIHTIEFSVRHDRYREQMLELAGMIRGEVTNPYSYEHDYLVQQVVLAASGYAKWR